MSNPEATAPEGQAALRAALTIVVFERDSLRAKAVALAVQVERLTAEVTTLKAAAAPEPANMEATQ